MSFPANARQPRLGTDERTLASLLDTQVETERLDFKAALDLRTRRHVVSLAKDIAAMAALGGHIAIGVNEDGRPSGRLTDSEAELLDESRLRAKIGKYLPGEVAYRTTIHRLDGSKVVLLAIDAHPDGFCIMATDGNRDDGCEFRAGDVFVRRGTSTVRASPDDMRAIRERMRRDARRAALADIAPASDRAVRDWLARFPAQVRDRLSRGRALEGVAELLDEVAAILTRAIVEGDDKLFLLALRRLGQVYENALDDLSPAGAVPASAMGALLGDRLYLVGAFAVRERRFDLVRKLTVQPIRSARMGPSLWLKDMQRKARAADLHWQVGDGRRRYVGVIRRAELVAATGSWATPDDATDECLRTSLCEFDLLASLVSIDHAGSTSAPFVHSGFTACLEHRIDPVVVELLDSRGELRRSVFPREDAELASALKAIRSHAHSSAAGPSPAWDDYEDERIRAFLDRG